MGKKKKGQLQAKCSRYLVPFFYGKDGTGYEQLNEKLLGQDLPQWELADVKKQTEQDVYEYLLHAFSGHADATSLGSVWRYTGEGDAAVHAQDGLKHLLYNSSGKWEPVRKNREEKSVETAEGQVARAQSMPVGEEKEGACAEQGARAQSMPVGEEKEGACAEQGARAQSMPVEEEKEAVCAVQAEECEVQPVPEEWEIPEGAVSMDKKRVVDVWVKKAGLFLFKSGVGFFWYELEVQDRGQSVSDWKKMQNKFKELNRREESLRLLEVCGKSFLEGASVPDTLWCKKTDGSELKVEKLILKRMRTAQSIQEKCPDTGKKIIKEIIPREGWKYWQCQKFTFGNWAAQILGQLSKDIQYCAPKKNCLLPPEQKQAGGEMLPFLVPDKALIYYYATLEQGTRKEVSAAEEIQQKREKEGDVSYLDMQQVYACLYHLSNGYTDAYHMPEQITERMYRPFENVLWMASREGCACLGVARKGAEFLNDGMIQKITNDYFLLYVLALHQSYTLLKFADEISSQMPAQWDVYTQDEEAIFTALEQKMAAIQVFLMKSTTASVSHIQHQNEFYRYLQHRLQIREDIKSVTQGLGALTEIQRIHCEARQRQKEKAAEEQRRQEKEAQEAREKAAEAQRQKEKEAQEAREKAAEAQRQKEKEIQRAKEKADQEKQDMVDTRLNLSLGMLSLLAVISAYCDGTALLQMWIGKAGSITEYLKQPKYWLYVGVYVLVTIAAFMVIKTLVSTGCHYWKQKREMKKKKDTEPEADLPADDAGGDGKCSR